MGTTDQTEPDRAAGLSHGGMACKLEAARQVTAAGGNVIIKPVQQPAALSGTIMKEGAATL